jgi:hypothetical protein
LKHQEKGPATQTRCPLLVLTMYNQCGGIGGVKDAWHIVTPTLNFGGD